MNEVIWVKINPQKNFDSIFGAECFRKNWPNIETDIGIPVRKFGPDGWWYVWDIERNWLVDETAFFSKEDMKHLIKIENVK